MWIPDFLVKLFGRGLAGKMNLEEGAPMPTKPWYTSKTVWSDVLTILVGALGVVDKYITNGQIVSSPYYGMALTLLGGMGIISRANATTTLSK